MERKLKAFKDLLTTMDILREKCPWDKEQSFESLKTLSIEEVYELAEAISMNNTEDIKEELGDILLHIVFYAKIASETNKFDIGDVCKTINEKLIYRHPHIFGDTKVFNSDDVLKNWELLKLKEKGGTKTVLGGLPKALPALVKAYRIQDKVRGVGFDWAKREDVWAKVKEEILEVEEEIKNNNQTKTEEEFGDLFFSLINAARLYNVNPENALEKTNKKFIKRFNYLEKETISKGLDLKELGIEEMNKIWEKAKKYDDK